MNWANEKVKYYKNIFKIIISTRVIGKIIFRMEQVLKYGLTKSEKESF